MTRAPGNSAGTAQYPHGYGQLMTIQRWARSLTIELSMKLPSVPDSTRAKQELEAPPCAGRRQVSGCEKRGNSHRERHPPVFPGSSGF